MRCITQLTWGWDLNLHFRPQTIVCYIRRESGKAKVHSFDSETHVFSLLKQVSFYHQWRFTALLLAWWQGHFSLPGAFWQGVLKSASVRTWRMSGLLEIKSQGLWWNTLLRNVISPKLWCPRRWYCMKHKHQWLWVEKRHTKVKFQRQRCGITWPIYLLMFSILYMHNSDIYDKNLLLNKSKRVLSIHIK